MVKKIKKYVKLVVCCVLIMSLVAPSYAALSASDGSAFVTKAEFDAALADFNSRLTTFEAGINSKIDSQVTSYLDRNGIWNGKAQTLNMSNLDTVNLKLDADIFKPISSSITLYRWGLGTPNDPSLAPGSLAGKAWGAGNNVNVVSNSRSYSSGWYIGHTPAVDTEVRNEILFTADKSGLVFAPFVLSRGASSSNYCKLGGTNVSWASGHPSYGISWSSIFKFKVGSAVKASMTQSRYLSTSTGWSATEQWDSVPAETITGTCLFFVSKGDAVHLSRSWSVGGNQSIYVVTNNAYQSAVASTVSFPEGVLIY